MATAGALAAVPQPVRTETAPAPQPASQPSRPPRQGLLFQEKPAGKIIPFEALTTPVLDPGPRIVPPPNPKPATRTTTPVQPRRAEPPNDSQPSLDFLPPAPPAARKLGTSVEAVIFCEAQVAVPMHRGCAAAIDASMIVIAFGLFLTTFHLLGGALTPDKLTILVMVASLALVAVFYSFLWAWAGGETLGMRATHLKLINFDGYPPDRVARWMRFVGSCLSYCAGGLGILWTLVDEESLGWHDHISKTFPTFRGPETNFVRRR
jgi:uncharacterized RDD family membrane protein YckC